MAQSAHGPVGSHFGAPSIFPVCAAIVLGLLGAGAIIANAIAKSDRPVADTTPGLSRGQKPEEQNRLVVKPASDSEEINVNDPTKPNFRRVVPDEPPGPPAPETSLAGTWQYFGGQGGSSRIYFNGDGTGGPGEVAWSYTGTPYKFQVRTNSFTENLWTLKPMDSPGTYSVIMTYPISGVSKVEGVLKRIE